MSISLIRERDGAGDCGPMSTALVPVYDDAGKIVDVTYEDRAVPRVGVAMRVGSPYARTYSGQDYWQTTLITEIISDEVVTREDYVDRVIKFRTGNSVYTWTGPAD